MDNVVEQKSFHFSVRIVNLCKYLQTDRSEYILSKQLLRSGTSIGANIAESKHAQSRSDFTANMSIALKEASETEYWLKLLHATNYLNQAQADSILADCEEILRLLASIVKTTKGE